MNSKLVIVLGPGGVGKTTTSVAIGAAFARQGHRVVVMTVDPARRLAQALGLEELNHEPQIVKTYEKGKLEALWLSQNGALETLAKKHAPDEESLHQMLNHKFFRIIDSQLGGIEEYLGIERALSLVKSGDYDVCVLDTPPSKHALDFFESPQHLLEFLDESILRFFLDSPQDKATWLGRTLSFGKNRAFDLFKNLLGQSFFKDLATLLSLVQPLHTSLKTTAQEAEILLRSENCHYALVGVLEKKPLEELEHLNSMLTVKGLSHKRYWLANKVLPLDPNPSHDILSFYLGKNRATIVEQQKLLQTQLLEKIQKHSKLPAVSAITPCYSSHQMHLTDLEILGERILQQWALTF